MTAREVYEATLVEINKENAQSFSTEAFNYVHNKSILALVNDKYNFYATNQKMSDDLRVLLKNQTYSMNDTTEVEANADTVAVFNPTTGYVMTDMSATSSAVLNTARDFSVNDTIRFGESVTEYNVDSITGNTLTLDSAATVERGTSVLISNDPIAVPDSATGEGRTVDINYSSSDYLHLLSCRLLWKTVRPSNNEIAHFTFPAKSSTYDMLNGIQNNTYLKPASNRPYYQIFDNLSNSGVITYDASAGDYKANQNRPRIKIHIGSKNNFMELRRVEFDYLKIPEIVTLKDEDIFSADVDTSQILELPDGLLNDIVRRCTAFLLEMTGDPRVQTQPMVNQSMESIPLNMQMAAQRSRPQTRQTTTQQQ